MTTTTPPWDRQEGESSRAYARFTLYRDLGPGRSLDKAYGLHKGLKARATRAPRAWKAWSSRWGWVERAAAWDSEQDRRARERIAANQVEARVRHAMVANMNLRALGLPPSAVLVALRDDPTLFGRVVEEVRQSSSEVLWGLVELAARCGSAMPGLAAVERQALGLRDEVSVEVTTVSRTSLGWKIPGNPKAVELAVALLDQLARGDE